MKQTFYFTGISKIGVQYETGHKTSHLAETSIRLEISKNLNKEMYLQRDLPAKEGIMPLTQAFVQGIIANIKMAHKKGWWTEADHMKYVVDELSRAFVSVANADPNMEESFL